MCSEYAGKRSWVVKSMQLDQNIQHFVLEGKFEDLLNGVSDFRDPYLMFCCSQQLKILQSIQKLPLDRRGIATLGEYLY